MRDDANPRKKIPYKKPTLEPAIEDDQAYGKNKASDKARKVQTLDTSIKLDIWFDKHYTDRSQFGDSYGLRSGIDSHTVKDLIIRGLDHIIAYSSIVSGFKFANLGDNPSGLRYTRIILQEDTKEGMLNVVLEIHMSKINHYEITVKTAMCESNFKMSDNQYAIEISGGESVLYKHERGKKLKVQELTL